MRLYLFPITRSRTLIYCKRKVVPRVALNPDAPPTKPPIIERITAKANATWLKWESEKGGWRKKVTGWGNQAFARIAYEEWGVKSIPPLSKKRRGEETRLAEIPRDDPNPKQRALRKAAEVDVVFPTGLIDREGALGILRRLTGESKRSDYRKRIWWSVLAMPLTLPFIAIPVVPNLPFFYLVFRAWSLWRAQAGCAHVEHLIAQDLINTKPSTLLRRVYDAAPVGDQKIKLLGEEVGRLKEETKDDHPDLAIEDATMKILGEDGSEDARYATEKETLFYPKGHGKAMALALNLPEVEEELERAYNQVSSALEKENQSEQAQGLDEKPKKK